jgi:uncharacterized membrane protein YidH (DUF202 family)
MGSPIVIVGVLITTFGVVRFIRMGREIERSKKHVGNASLDFIRSIKGEDMD